MNYHFSAGRRPVVMSCLRHALEDSGRTLAGLFLLSLSFAYGLPAHSATVPGTTPGSFGVSETGAATYSIPIAVPPGTAGMEPKLSLNYSSQGGNGIAGVGWSLGGLSAVTRCPQTVTHDGQTRGVQLDANDRFCLDGQRLILTAGAGYGAVGAEYRTEVESFAKIVSIGGTAGDPQSFAMWTKAGQIIEFGNTPDSRAEAQGKSVAGTWAVNKISDTVGNYMAFSYQEDSTNGEHRIARVDYTGNTAGSVLPYNAVEFQYEGRPDVETGYVKGSKSQASQRLAKLVTYAGGNVVKDYSLEYETGVTTGKSRLISVVECAGNDCLSPTTFAWQEGAPGLKTAENTGIPDVNALYTRAIDLNGDGLTDLVYPAGTTWKVRLSQGSAFSSEIDSGIANTGYQYARPVDFNSDGRIDMLVPYANGRWYLMRATGNPSTPFDPPVDTGIVDGGKAANPQLLDINGDGHPDIVHAHDSYWYSALGNGAGFGADTKSNMPYVQNGYGYYAFDWGRPADFQGDGLADVLIPRLYQRYLCGGFSICEDIRWDVITRPGSGPLTVLPTNIRAFLYSGVGGTGVIYIQKSQQAIDINRDGATDLLTMGTDGAGGASWWLCQNWGGDLVHCSNTTFAAPTAGQLMIQTDWNSDGKPDMLAATNGGSGNWTVYRTNSNGTGMTQLDSGISQQGYNANPLVGDFNGDGLLDLMLAYGGAWNLHLHNGTQPDRVVSITDGMGAARTVDYKPLTDNTVYSKGSGAAFPLVDFQDATYVVSETAADDGVGGQFRNTYRYEGARTHLTGRGFLGFKVLEQTDLQSGVTTRTEFSQAFPNIGTPLLVTKTSSGGVELSRVESTPSSTALNGGKTFFPYVAYSKEQGKDLDGTPLPSTETWNTYADDWGNLTQTISQTSDGFKKQTDNTYSNDVSKWHLGRLTRVSVTSTINNGGWSQTRVSAFEYHATTGLLTREIIEPDQPQYRLDTVYAHDVFGNRQSVTVSSPATGLAAIATRTSTTTYDSKGQFPVNTANALGHTETKTFDPRFGTVVNLTGPNALTTTWQYDGFGRKTRETRVDGTLTQWTYDGCDAACPANAVSRIVTQVFGGGVQSAPTAVAYFDRLSREVRAATQGFDGRWIYTDKQYDGQGRVAQASRPYFAGEAVYWSRSEYDDLGRLVHVYEPDAPDTAALILHYNGLTVSRANRKGQTTTEVSNSQGQKISVTDALGSVTTYGHDPFGNLQFVQSNGELEAANAYDIRGRKIYGYTPDTRNWTYVHNVLGELVQQTDAKGQVTTMAYDKLGRMSQRIEPGLNSEWIYDTAAYGKGKLHVARTDAGYIRTHYYDEKGRSQLTLSNLGAGNPLLISSVAYDAAGRVHETYYSSGLGLKNIYNATGYPAELRKVGDNTVYWQQNAMDAEGHSLQETLGNGTVSTTTYDPRNGRFNYRIDNRNGVWIGYHSQLYDPLGNISERYQLGGTFSSDMLGYDPLNRLVQVDSNVGGVLSIQALTYTSGGNIRSKTGVGDYYYGGNANCTVGNGAGSHAVCKAGSNTYTYDANGNLMAGGGRVIGWTAWNMPGGMIESGQNTTWLYGPEHDRYKMVTAGRTTWYLNPGVHQGGHYEQTRYASGTYEHRHTLYGGGKPIGEVLTFTADGAAPASQTRYFHSDAQGSITTISDQNGQVITRFKYDAWGKQTLVAGSNTGIDATRQGHTGHEMLDGGLTHMNGRLYDPLLSRFVSADPIVQAPYDLQSLNRYSYVMNNPLYYTDPTGFSWWTDFRDGFVKPVLSIAAAVYLPGSSLFTSMGLTGTSGVIAAGAVSGAITGGGRGALAGAVSAGMFSQLHGMSPGIGKIAAHGVVGGMMSEMQGGSFKSGFLAAGFTQGVSQMGGFDRLGNPSTTSGKVANAVGAAIVGGTASVIGGGKFANGAMTGAFSRLFNDLNTAKSCPGKCARVYDPKAKDYMWVPAVVAGQSAAAAQTGGTLDSLHTSPTEARKLAQATVLTVGLVAAPLGSGTLATYSLFGGAALTISDPNSGADDYTSTALSFATRGLSNYGVGTWVEDFASGVESYNTLWQIGDFAKNP